MIDFKNLQEKREEYRLKYLTAKPFAHLVLKDIVDEEKLLRAYSSIGLLENKSRDFIFANNKFEKSNYWELSVEFQELFDDFQSDEFRKFLSYISNKNIFVDPANHGGGLHQGRSNSFLEMHLDYNYHPIQTDWWREMNILFYMNLNWEESFGGHLKLHDLRTDEKIQIPVHWNTLIIQECHDYTLHGYDQTNFPEGVYRTSIATYAFSRHKRALYKARTTDWILGEDRGRIKSFLGRKMPQIIKLKSLFFGSQTAKNN